VKPAAQRRKEWARDRKAFADEWFEGDETFAEEFLESLPYSEIPGWWNAHNVMETLSKQGELRHE
jgi:hypothetical protein